MSTMNLLHLSHIRPSDLFQFLISSKSVNPFNIWYDSDEGADQGKITKPTEEINIQEYGHTSTPLV
jgi:hypothetical protein